MSGSIHDLPPELRFHIYDSLYPEQIIREGLTNKSWLAEITNGQGLSQELWDRKYQKHFPHLYNDFVKKRKSNPKTNCYEEFIRTYKIEYKGLKAKESELFSLVKEKDFDRLKARLDEEEDAYSLLWIEDKSGKGLIEWARMVGDQRILDLIYGIAKKYFAKHKAKDTFFYYDRCDTEEGDRGRSILYYAIYCNQKLEEIKSLFQDAKINIETFKLVKSSFDNIEFHDCPLIYAAECGRLDIIELLLTNDPTFINKPSSISGKRTPLMFAANRGHLDIVKYFLLMVPPLNVNAVDAKGNTALHYAERAGHLPVIQLMIETDPASIELQDKFGQTPLLLAAAHGHQDIVTFLLEKGAKLSVTTNNPGSYDHAKSPLDWAIKNGHEEIAKMLLNHIDKNEDEKKMFAERYKSNCEHIINIILNDINMIKNDTETRSGSTFFDKQRLNDMITLYYDIWDISNNVNLSYYAKLEKISISISNTYDSIFKNVQAAPFAKKSKTATLLLKALTRLCEESGIVLKTIENDKIQLKQITELRFPGSLKMEQYVYNNYEQGLKKSAGHKV